jgi:hypothetical protein
LYSPKLKKDILLFNVIIQVEVYIGEHCDV